MADGNDVRRIAATLPDETVKVARSGQTKVTFRGKGLAWTWVQRPDGGGRSAPNPEVLDPQALAELLTEAWRLRAPKRLQREVGL